MITYADGFLGGFGFRPYPYMLLEKRTSEVSLTKMASNHPKSASQNENKPRASESFLSFSLYNQYVNRYQIKWYYYFTEAWMTTLSN